MATIPYVKNTTWADGPGGATPDTAAKKNLIEDGIYSAHLQPAVRAFHNAAQATLNGANTALALNSERFDTAAGAADTQHDLVTNNSRLTCRYAGIYQITANIEWVGNATGDRALGIRLNGATFIGQTRQAAVSTVNLEQSITTVYQLAVNDYVEAIAAQTSGGNLNVSVVGNISPEFMMARVA